MPFSFLPPLVATFLIELSSWLDRRAAPRVRAVACGMIFAKGRRTVTSWFRAAGIGAEFRQAYAAINTVGREARSLAFHALRAAGRLLGRERLLVAIDDSPTKRYGPEVEGAGTHRHPSPGPADGPFLYGHVFVASAVLAKHPSGGTIALPVMADMHVRAKDIPSIPPERCRASKTKLELAAEQIAWLGTWTEGRFDERWAVVDGGYASRPFLGPAREAGFVVVGRLRKDAALFGLPEPREPGTRGRPRIYGEDRLSLAKRAAHPEGWEQVECEQYGERVAKTAKTFLATWRPARGVVRVVIVREEDGWLAFFCTKADATAAEILEAAADRNALEQGFKAAKEAWGAGEQQVRNIDSSEGCFNLGLWMMTVVEAWAWDRPEEELADREASPWDSQPRRPSHADKRKALQRQVLREEISETLRGEPTKAEMQELADRLLALAP